MFFKLEPLANPTFHANQDNSVPSTEDATAVPMVTITSNTIPSVFHGVQVVVGGGNNLAISNPRIYKDIKRNDLRKVYVVTQLPESLSLGPTAGFVQIINESSPEIRSLFVSAGLIEK